jgi:hypothetical protein
MVIKQAFPTTVAGLVGRVPDTTPAPENTV